VVIKPNRRKTMGKIHVLVIVSDRHTNCFVTKNLEEKGYLVDTTPDIQEALACLINGEYQLIILDMQLIKGACAGLLKELKQKGKSSVILLSAEGYLPDQIYGICPAEGNSLPHRFPFTELTAIVNAQSRRRLIFKASPEQEINTIRCHNMELDIITGELIRDGDKIQLRPKEFALLKFFMTHPDQVFTKPQIFEMVWGEKESPEAKSVLASQINNLRFKLESDPSRPRYLCTVWGVGYKFRG
jgi:DNA-binding response OmpR family regulator